MAFHPRSDWVDPRYPVTGLGYLKGQVISVVIHYCGSNFPDLDFDNDGDVDRDDTAVLLRQINQQYLASRNYAIGYNYAVGQEGDVWECRGMEFRNAANDGIAPWYNYNPKSVSILIITDWQDKANDRQVQAVRNWIAWLRAVHGIELLIKGHRDVDSTACPGLGIGEQLKAGLFEPNNHLVDIPDQPVPAPDEEDDDVKSLVIYWPTGYANSFLYPSGLHLTAELKAHYERLGVPVARGPLSKQVQKALSTINGMPIEFWVPA